MKQLDELTSPHELDGIFTQDVDCLAINDPDHDPYFSATALFKLPELNFTGTLIVKLEAGKAVGVRLEKDKG